MQNNKQVSISIMMAGYNAGEYLPGCLESIYAQTYKDFEVIFVDNGSTDNTKEVLNSYPKVNVIANHKNMGFCYANNQGIKAASGKWLLTLNCDVILDIKFLSELMKAAQNDGAALFGVKILRPDRKIIDSTGLVLSGCYRFFDRGSGEADKGQYDQCTDIFGPCGAAALYKKDMLEDIKQGEEYFDEAFFFLLEDFDIAWRAKCRKWMAKFVPKAVCYHTRNSTNFDIKFRQYLSFKNRFFLLVKNVEFDIRYFYIFFIYDLPRFLWMSMTNKYIFKALDEIIRYTPIMLSKRNFCGIKQAKY